MIKSINDCYVEISELLKPNALRGAFPGNIPVLNEHYSCRLGNTTLITGYPSSGKSFFAMNIQAALSVKHSWRHLLYTPEMGTAGEIYITIAEILTGKSVGYGLDEQTLTDVSNYIHERFVVYEPPTLPTMEKLTKEISIHAKKKTIHTFSIDNLNDLSHSVNGTQDIYFEQQMLMFNNCAKQNNLHGFLLAHPAKPQPDDLKYAPSPDKIKGGSAFWSKGQTIIALRDAGDYLEVCIYKVKPRYIGKRGEFTLIKQYRHSTYAVRTNQHGDDLTYLFPQIR